MFRGILNSAYSALDLLDPLFDIFDFLFSDSDEGRAPAKRGRRSGKRVVQCAATVYQKEIGAEEAGEMLHGGADASRWASFEQGLREGDHIYLCTETRGGEQVGGVAVLRGAVCIWKSKGALPLRHE